MTLLATLASMSTMVNSIGPAFKGIGQIATKMFSDLKTFVSDKFFKPIQEKLDELGEWWEGFKTSAADVWQSIQQFAVDNFFTPIGDLLKFIGTGFFDFGKGVFEVFTDIWNFVNDNFFSPIGDAILFIGTAFFDFGKGVFEVFTDIWNFVNDNFFSPIGDAILFIGTAFINFGKGVFDVFKAMWDFADFVFITPISKGISFLIDLVGNIWDSLPSLPEIFSLKYWIGLGLAIGTSIFDALNGVGDLLGDIFSMENLSDTLGGVTTFLGEAFKLAIEPFRIGINSLLIDVINGITGYQLPIIGESLRSITGFGEIPHLAKGGIVNKPTLAMIGEDGPEAVVPLSQRNNPSGAGMGGATYNITVNAGGITDRTDKRALAREIGNMIQQELARSIGGSTMRGRY